MALLKAKKRQGIDYNPLAFLYSDGVMPVSFLKHLLKYFGSEKPTIYAICEKGYWLFVMSSSALCMRICLRKSTGDMPTMLLILP